MSDVTPFVLPDAKSWLARIYVYWLKTTHADIPRQENFCHFWRVILIWAPLEWLYMTKRGWRGMLRPYTVLALALFMGVIAGLALAAGTSVGVWEMIVWMAYGLIGVFGAAAFYEEELDAHDGNLRWGLMCSGFWGVLLLGIVGVVLAAMSCDEWWKKRSRSSKPARKPKREKRPSETAEFIWRLLGQIHARICPPVEFDFDLAKAAGRRKESEDWLD